MMFALVMAVLVKKLSWFRADLCARQVVLPLMKMKFCCDTTLHVNNNLTRVISSRSVGAEMMQRKF